MAVPVLKLNLAPPPTLWRQHHQLLGWTCLAVGALALIAAAAVSLLAYRDAVRAGKDVVLSTADAQKVIRQQLIIQDRLRSVDVEKELPIWRLAERILGERSLPWSRVTAELERSLVQDVRLKSIQRTRNAAQSVELKIRGEAKSRAAEEAFVAELQKNAFFAQVILEREADRQGGGVEFEYTLPVSATPPPFAPLPKYGPARSAQAPTAPPSSPGPAQKAVAEKPAPAPAPPVQNPPAAAPVVQPVLRRPARLEPNRLPGIGQPNELSREARP